MESLSVWQLLRLQSLRHAFPVSADGAADVLALPAEVLVPHASLLHSLVDKGFENFRDIFQGLGGLVWDVRTPGRSDPPGTRGIFCAVYPASAADEDATEVPAPMPIVTFVDAAAAKLPAALAVVDIAPFAASINAYVTLAVMAALKQPRPESGIPPLPVAVVDDADAAEIVVAADGVRVPRLLTVDLFYELVARVVEVAAARTLGIEGAESREVAVREGWVLVVLAATISYVRRHDQVQAARFPMTLLEQLALHLSAERQHAERRAAALTRFDVARLQVEFTPDDDDNFDADAEGDDAAAPKPPRLRSYADALNAIVAPFVKPAS